MNLVLRELYKVIASVTVILSLALTVPVRAATPSTINTQIRLKNAAGNPITTATTIQFSIYGASASGAPSDSASSIGPLLWKEVYDGSSGSCPQITPDTQGYFNVALGSCTSLPSYLTFNTTSLYLGIKVGSDAEMSPRLSLGTAPFAFNSERLGGFTASSTAVPGALLALDQSLGFNIVQGAFTGGLFSLTSSTATSTVAGNISVAGFASFSHAAYTGGLALASTTPLSTTNTLYNQGGTLYWNGSAIGTASSASFSAITIANGTSTNQFITNLNATNATATTLFATSATFVNATTTGNQIIGGSLTVNGTSTLATTTISNLSVTGTSTFNGPAVLTGFNPGSVLFIGSQQEITQNPGITFLAATNTLSLSGTLTLASTSPVTTTNALYNQNGALYWNGDRIGTSASATFTNATFTNATTTNQFITNLAVTAATATNFFATSAVFAGATSTNLTVTNLTATNATATNQFATNLSATNATTTNLAGTTASFTTMLWTNATGTGSTNLNTLNVTGATTLTTTTASNLTVSNTSTFNGAALLNGFSSGSVLFTGTDGVISQNNSNFFWDAANNRLGLGTTTPANRLTVNGGISIASTAPATASNTLYNQSGVLYWNGSPVTAATTSDFTSITWVNATGTGITNLALLNVNNTSTLATTTVSALSANTLVVTGTSTLATTSVTSLSAGTIAVARTSTFAQGVAIGTTGTPTAALEVVGDIKNIFSSPTRLTTFSSTSLASNLRSVRLVGKTAYIARQGSSLFSIYDVTNQYFPKLVGSASVPNSFDVDVAGKYAYLVNDDENLVVVDVSRPTNPTIVATSSLTNDGYHVSVQGRYVYVKILGNILRIYDVLDPIAPVYRGQVSLPGNTTDFVVQGDFAYSPGSGNIQVIDIRNPASPVMVGSSTQIIGTLFNYGIAVQGRYAYIQGTLTGTGQAGLYVFDIASSTAPSFIASTSVFSGSGTNPGSGLSVQGRYIFYPYSAGLSPVGYTNYGVAVMDVSSSTAPTTTGATYFAGDGGSMYMDVQGSTIALISNAQSTLIIAGLPSGEFGAAVIHSAEVGGLVARDGVVVQGGLKSNSLQVGENGIATIGGLDVQSTSSRSSISGFTSLGDLSPFIKVAYFTGTAPSATNTCASINLTGMTAAKIIDMRVNVTHAADAFISNNNAYFTDYQWDWYMSTEAFEPNLFICLTAANSGNILNEKVKAVVFYTP